MESIKKNAISVKAIFFYTALFVICMTVIANKRNFHVDEIFTYGLSNNTSGGGYNTIAPKNAPYMYEPAENAYYEYMAVQEGARFNFKNVWNLQEQDVHPPFYYALVHMVSSIFIGSGSKWIAAAVNIVFMLLTLWMARKILCLFDCDEKEKVLISAFFILSIGMMQNLSFLRMYVMVMFMVTLCTYWILKAFMQKCTIWYWGGLSIIAIAGTLTHYYFLIYLFFISLFFGLYLLFNRKFADAAKYILSMLIAGGGCYCIFPPMLKHIFGGYRGEQSFDNLKGDIVSYWDHLKMFWTYIDKDLFGGCLVTMICIGVFLFIAGTKRDRKELEHKNLKWMWCCLGGACSAYFLLVAKIAVYTTERYMYPIYAVLLIFIVLAMKRFLDLFFRKYYKISIMIWAMLLGIMTAEGHKDVYWTFLYLDCDALLEKAAEYGDVDCLYVYKAQDAWKAHNNYMEVKNYRRITFFDNNVDMLAEMQDLRKEKEFVLYIVDCDADSVISQIMELCPQINAYDKLWSFGYATTYRLYGKDSISDKGYLRNYDKTLYLNCEDGTGNISVSENETLVMTLKSNDTDYYNIYVQDGVVDLDHGVLAEGQNIQKFSPNGTDAQKWRITENADGTVTIYAYNSDYCLNYDDTGNIYISRYSSDEMRQKWWFQVE